MTVPLERRGAADPGAAMRVVATAGHVDHGKSSLVRALTGTDPDRWEEEKRRGLTIDLGFAFTTTPSGGHVAFVDVPGHVRFLQNMLAGVGAVGAALLVVAANEGWMPQTEEHLRILELLGVEHGLTVLSKADTVDGELLELARLELDDRVRGSFLEHAPVVVADALSGRGIDDVGAALTALVGTMPAPEDAGRPRLWVDRVFTVQGSGTVVTGTLTGGMLREGDEVELSPGARRARVRGLQSAHQRVAVGLPGTRVAANLSGVDHRAVARGDALVLPGQWVEASVADVAFHPLSGTGELPARARLKAYVGSAEREAVYRRIDGGTARLFFDAPVPLAPGDRLVLRDPGPALTVGGAEVLDVAPRVPLRSAAGVLGRPLGERVLAGRSVVAAGELPRLTGLSASLAAALADRLVEAGAAVRVDSTLVDPDHAAAVLDALREAVDRHHHDHPLAPGLPLGEAATRLGADPSVLGALAGAAVDLEVDGGVVRQAGHRPSPLDDPRSRELLAALEASPFSPPSPAELGVPADVVRALEREGAVVTVGDVVLSAEALAEATRRIVARLDEQGEVTVADVRDLLGSSRRYVLPLLAHLDTEAVTRRRGDVRVAGPRARRTGTR